MVNVMAIGGEPCSGKTTLVFKLMEETDDWIKVTPKKTLDALYSKTLNTYILGKYEIEDNLFQGTDRLSMAVQPMATEFFQEAKDCNVLFEGDRLFNMKMLDFLSERFPDTFKILILTVKDDTLDHRHIIRKDSQDDAFKRSRKTKVGNIRSSLVLMDYIQPMVNENANDQAKIIGVVKDFFGWSDKNET